MMMRMMKMTIGTIPVTTKNSMITSSTQTMSNMINTSSTNNYRKTMELMILTRRMEIVILMTTSQTLGISLKLMRTAQKLKIKSMKPTVMSSML